MKSALRVILLLLAGLSLAGCATTTAMEHPTPAKVVAQKDQILNARDYWFLRDVDDRFEARLASNASR